MDSCRVLPRQHMFYIVISLILAANLFLIPNRLNALNSAISYNFDNCGRLGDCILLYCKAKYLSLKTGLPLLFRAFPNSYSFAMHYNENHYSQNLQFYRYIAVHNMLEIDPNADSTLFLVNLLTSTGGPYIHESQFLPTAVPMRMNFMIDEIYQLMQENDEYKNIIKQMLQLPYYRDDFQAVSGEDIISVAVHIRKGSGYDNPLFSKQIYTTTKITMTQDFLAINYNDYLTRYHDIVDPLRFPPEQYYIDQINKLSTCFHNKKLYIQLFTDHNTPEELLQRFREQCQEPNCIISLATGQWQNDVIKDLYHIALFDCLIRPSSHFSGVSQLIGNHKLIISPKNYKWVNDCLIITENNIVVNDDTFKTLIDPSIVCP